MDTINRFLSALKQSFFLLGPRGTGKSTWIKTVFPNALYIDLLLPDVYRSYLAKPERLVELVEANPKVKTIVIDEIQRIPQILDAVHSLMETRKGVQFILTGSSARKLKKTGADLLAGRALMVRMHPFIAAELGNQFNLDTALAYGLVPVIVASNKPKASLQAYVDLYLREEVQMEGLTRNIGNFARFLEAASFSHGSVLNVSNIARECGIERKVVEGYIGILEDLLLAYRLPIFTRRAARATAQHPKFFFYDTGIYRALRPSGPIDRPEEMAGAALEGLVAQHLRAWLDYRHPEAKLFYWRTPAGNEVDFIVYGKGIFWAIEVKNASTLHPQDMRPLKAFGEDYPEATRIILYRGKDKLKRDGILMQPCDNFLMNLK